MQHIKQQKSSQSKSGSASFIDATSWGSAPTLFDNDVNKQNDAHLWAAIALVNDNNNRLPSFMLDTCASHHVTNIRSALVNLHPAEVINFGLAGTVHQFSSYEEGDLRIPVEDGSILIKGIRYSPGANHSLLSASCLRAAKWHIDLEKEYLRFGPHKFTLNWDNRHNFPATDFTLKAHAALVALFPQPPAPFNELLAVHNVESPLYQEHMRLSHLSRESLLDLVKERKLKYDYDTLKSDDFRLSDCSACTAATSRHQPRTGESPCGSADGEMVHVNLTGWLKLSAKGNEYALIMYSVYTRVHSVVLLRNKSDAMHHVEAFIIRLKHQANIKVKTLRSDHSSEFPTQPLCNHLGINHQTTPGYAPEFNGVAEHAVGFLKGKTAVLLLASSLGHDYWDYAMVYAMMVLNKTTPSSIQGKTAWEVIMGCQLDLNKIYTFSDLVFAHIPSGLRPVKADLTTPKARLARILGQDENVTSYIVQFEHNGSVHLADVTPASGLDTTPVHKSTAPSVADRTTSLPTAMMLPETENSKDIATKDIMKDKNQNMGNRALGDGGGNKDRLAVSSTDAMAVESNSIMSGVVQPTPVVLTPVSTVSPRCSTRLQKADHHHGPNARIAFLASETALILAVTSVDGDSASLSEALSRPDGAQWHAAKETEINTL